jgi:hypothetical protein
MSTKKQKLSNDVINYVPQAKVICFSWELEDLSKELTNSDLSDSTGFDISAFVTSINFSKNMTNPSGTFSFSLANSTGGVGSGDWKDIIKRGSWLVIYMTQVGDLTVPNFIEVDKFQNNPSSKIRCIGYVDRVAVTSSLNENGAFDVTYEVSGRDFGVIYEDTNIWHNLFLTEKALLDSVGKANLDVLGQTTVDVVLSTVHDLFYFPESVKGARLTAKGSVLESLALQWLLPRKLLKLIGTPSTGEESTENLRFTTLNFGDAFLGKVIKKNFAATPSGISVSNPLDFLTGNAWENLKNISVPELHELFTETDDKGFPNIIFRPIPFGINNKAYPILAKKITLYKDLPSVTLEGSDIISFSLGEENHSRYNSFLVTVVNSHINQENNIQVIKDTRFPFTEQASVKRHGFRAMHTTVNSLVRNEALQKGTADLKLLRDYNELLVDYWKNAVFSESGTLKIVGRNDIKIGKCILIASDVPYINGKRFYIEGYQDEFIVEDNGTSVWTQTLNLTRGFSEKDLKDKEGFETIDGSFIQAGDFVPSSGGKK